MRRESREQVMRSLLGLAVLLASASGATAQYVDTVGASVSVSGSEVTTTKRAGSNNVTTYVTESPQGTTTTRVYDGSGGTRQTSTFTPRPRR
jgi:hypothetical protein